METIQGRRTRLARVSTRDSTDPDAVRQPGVSPKTAQTLARHSDIRLTMGVYTHTNLDEQVAAVNRLPSLSTSDASAEDTKKSDNVSDPLQHSGNAPESQTGKLCQAESSKRDEGSDPEDRGASSQVPLESGFGDAFQPHAAADTNTPGGIRTPNPRFRRSWLCSTTIR